MTSRKFANIAEGDDNRKAKGNIIEEIVVALHESDEFDVKRSERLPSHRDPTRLREIDVLVTANVAGYPVRLAFECKNYGRPVNVQTVDGFYGKLIDVGIPPQHGILVSSPQGFTPRAIELARDHQIRTLVLDGITSDRLSAEVYEAIQSSVYLLLQITQLSITSHQETGSADTMLFLRDREGKLQGGIPDLVWADWRDGLIPEMLGEYTMPVKVPKNWEWQQDGATFSSKAEVQFRVIAIVVSERGNANRFALVDASSGEFQKISIRTRFEDNAEKFIVEVATDEEELADILQRRTIAQVVHGRIRMPRIQFLDKWYWPPSERVMLSLSRMVAELVQQGVPLEEGCLESITLKQLEGTDISVLWEPIWSEHPASKTQRWPWGRARKGKTRAKMVSSLPSGVPRSPYSPEVGT